MNTVSKPDDFGPSENDGQRMYRRWQDLGEEAFVAELIKHGDGYEMYKALARIPHWSDEARDKLLSGIVASKDPEGFVLAYECYKGIPTKIRNDFVTAAIECKDPRIAYLFLGSRHELRAAKRKALLEIVARDQFYAGCTRDFSKQISKEERASLG